MPETAAPSATALVVLVAVVVIAALSGGVALYYLSQPKVPPAPRTVVIGDNATVNYIGIFGSGPETGRVFDTSLYSVASNNASYPKTLQFHPRGAASNYTPLAVHVGNGTPAGGYSLGGLTFISVVPGFWQGLVGVAGNESRSIVVPPALGYGPTNASCFLTLPLVQTIPVVQTYTAANFSRVYANVTPASGLSFTDPHYGWPVTVLSANASAVVIVNHAAVGMTASPAGWPIVVTSVSGGANGSGAISLRNELSPSDAGHLAGHDFLGTGPCSAANRGQFIVWAVNTAAGTFTENFNSEVTGQTLIFRVTIVDVFSPVGNATAAA
jgi:FKBP-type peptidyl-prolyl cis-trans isomerase 2